MQAGTAVPIVRSMSAAATFCATLVDEWIHLGVRHAVVAPGSRSTPMAIALASRPELTVHVVHDERVAGFVALGSGLHGVPAIVLCTSGTAAANFLPAVVEAGLSEVPMLVLTADRPPEARDVGSAQTIDQTRLFGGSVRWFHDPGVPDAGVSRAWRSLARRSMTAAVDGPVHLNLPFREPLVGVPEALPERTGRSGPLTDGRVPGPRRFHDAVPSLQDRTRGIIVAGGRADVPVEQIAALAGATGWPVLADPTSPARASVDAITTADALVRHEAFARDHAPDVVIRIGRPPASRLVNEWIVRSGAPIVQIGGPGVVDPDHGVVARCTVDQLLSAGWTGATGTPWATRWRRAEERARDAIDRVLTADDSLTEPETARVVARSVGTDGGPDRLVVASSMPIRDVEWYAGPVPMVHANRGANGIDGTMSTALGLALDGKATAVLLGDVAFAHDANALVAVTHRSVDLRVVVVDNDGGGIFSFLPQATSLDTSRFEQLFGTPHGTDVLALAAAHGVATVEVTRRAELVAALHQPGPVVIRVPSDRARNVEVHRRINAAVVEALDRRSD